MDSLFDPERHRPVLGNRQEAVEQRGREGRERQHKGGRRMRRTENRSCKVGQAARPTEPGRQPPGADGGPVNSLVAVIPRPTAWGPREVLGSV